MTVQPARIEREMAKKPDPPVRLDAEVVRKAKAVAALEDKSLGEYLSDILRPIVDRDLKRHTKKIQGKEPNDG